VVGVVDVDLLEDGLVELAPDDGRGLEVGGVPVGGEGECFVEVGFGSVELDGELPGGEVAEKRTSASAPSRLPVRWATSAVTRVGTIRGSGWVSGRLSEAS
jgi:hypothetical protein